MNKMDKKQDACFYIQAFSDTYTDLFVWWAESGYTTDLDKAHKFTGEELEKIWLRDTNKVWSSEYIDKLSIRAIDRQHTYI